MTYSYIVFNTQFGWMAAVSSEQGLCKLTLPQPAPDKAMTLIADMLPKATASSSDFEDFTIRIERYFEGKETNFSDQLDLRTSTAFQQEVWRQTQSIPYGETRSYGEIAVEAGSPKAFRAVGQAEKRNEVPLVIPCHRVIGSDGSLTGYGGKDNTHIKAQLLDFEKTGLKQGIV